LVCSLIEIPSLLLNSQQRYTRRPKKRQVKTRKKTDVFL
jgi:hypothetical protein